MTTQKTVGHINVCLKLAYLCPVIVYETSIFGTIWFYRTVFFIVSIILCDILYNVHSFFEQGYLLFCVVLILIFAGRQSVSFMS